MRVFDKTIGWHVATGYWIKCTKKIKCTCWLRSLTSFKNNTVSLLSHEMSIKSIEMYGIFQLRSSKIWFRYRLVCKSGNNIKCK